MDEDAQSSHSEDAKRGEVLVNERVLLTVRLNLGKEGVCFVLGASGRISVVM